jgi:hypothetical protein
MECSVPTADEQVKFLRCIQRLLSEGSFVASYKYALLHALADLAVIKGGESGAPLELQTREIAERFIELYWRQTRPFLSRESAGVVLKQNTGRQAAVLSRITEAQEECGGSIARLKLNGPRWKALVGEVDRVVRVMPLWKLQTVGSEQVNFLYGNAGTGASITLKPGVAYCLRSFHRIIVDLVEGAWLNYVRKTNSGGAGTLTDLGSFLFGCERAALTVYRDVLVDVQKDTCFYCHKPMRRKGEADHFIPWSKYPQDLGHNFVLAHASCNNRKSDYLAAEEHIGAWRDRNASIADELSQRFDDLELPHDIQASVRVAEWAYGQTEKAGGQVWVRDRILKHLPSDWRRFLAAG